MAMTDQKARSWHHYYKNRQIFVLKWTCSSAGISPICRLLQRYGHLRLYIGLHYIMGF